MPNLLPISASKGSTGSKSGGSAGKNRENRDQIPVSLVKEMRKKLTVIRPDGREETMTLANMSIQQSAKIATLRTQLAVKSGQIESLSKQKAVKKTKVDKSDPYLMLLNSALKHHIWPDYKFVSTNRQLLSLMKKIIRATNGDDLFRPNGIKLTKEGKKTIAKYFDACNVLLNEFRNNCQN